MFCADVNSLAALVIIVDPDNGGDADDIAENYGAVTIAGDMLLDPRVRRSPCREIPVLVDSRAV